MAQTRRDLFPCPGRKTHSAQEQLVTHTAVDVDFAAGGADVVAAAAGTADVVWMPLRGVYTRLKAALNTFWREVARRELRAPF